MKAVWAHGPFIVGPRMCLLTPILEDESKYLNPFNEEERHGDERVGFYLYYYHNNPLFTYE